MAQIGHIIIFPETEQESQTQGKYRVSPVRN